MSIFRQPRPRSVAGPPTVRMAYAQTLPRYRRRYSISYRAEDGSWSPLSRGYTLRGTYHMARRAWRWSK